MKKLRICLLTILFVCTYSISISANGTQKTTIIQTFDNGSYIESTLQENSDPFFRSATQKKTGRKTNTYKSSSGKIIWSVTVKGSFTFNGKTSSCTSSTVTTSCPGAGWKITNSSANKSGATASASATAKKYIDGKCINTIARTVKLTCSKSGNLS